MKLRWTMMWAALAAGTAVEAGAQPRLPKIPRAGEPRQLAPERRGRDRADDVPPAFRPPPGMCRIWLDNVAPAQQPAPTDCNSAVRNRPANARVLFGDDYEREGADASRRAAPPVAVEVATIGTVATPSLAARWAPAVRSVGGRPYGPMADALAADDAAADRPGGDARFVAVSGVAGAADAAGGDSVARGRPAVQAPATRGAARPPARPAARRAAEPADVAADVDVPRTGDDWEAGYAAGYRDAANGRRPRVRGVDRAGDAAQGVRAGVRVPDDDEGVAGAPVVVVPPTGADVDPRYFNNGRFPPPGRANGVCLDRDGDGWCDDPRFGAPVCRDLDGDGRCDDYPALASAPLPTTLPDMRAGLDVQRGAGSSTALRWLGTSEVLARVTPSGRGGAPSRVVWLDANSGALLQVWTDRDGDGVADRVELYRDGRRVKLIGR